jgi:polysaccharide transporter, PST family
MNDRSASNATSRGALRPDTLAASVAILLTANLVQRSIGFGRGVLFCRWLAPNELGAWEMAYSFLLLAAPVVVLGLPGSFGRYLERYRQQGRLRTFLRRATIWTISLATAAAVLLVLSAPQFSRLIFGRNEHASLVLLLAASLLAVILHHFLEAVFAALRKFSIVSTMHFCQSITFAVLSLSLLWWWRLAAESIIIGYGLACLTSAVTILAWRGRALAGEVVLDAGVPHREFWPPLLRFAVWVWITNLLCHLFAVIDRYMLVHWSGLESAAALALVGHYHASRIVPLLFLSVADLLGGIVLPYLSHDWEAGDRQRVSNRLNLILKLAALVMLAGGVIVLWLAPLLFRFAFNGRYDAGLVILPWTLTYCIWYGLLLIARNYAWCAERMKLSTLPIAIGLAVNILLNLALIPAWGLTGAVVATTISTGLALAALYSINAHAGMQLQSGMLWFTLMPLALCGGVWCGTVSILTLIAVMPFSRMLLTPMERVAVTEITCRYLDRLEAYRSRRTEQPEPSHAT